jgi:hypothetical protein
MVYNGLFPVNGAQQLGFILYITYSGAGFNSYGQYNWGRPFDGLIGTGDTTCKASAGVASTATIQLRFVPLDDNIPAGLTGSMTSGGTTLTLSSSGGQHADGEYLNVAGAGVAGATLVTKVLSRSGSVFTVETAASAPVTNAVVTMNKCAPHSGSAYIAGVSYLNHTTMQGGNASAVGIYRGN